MQVITYINFQNWRWALTDFLAYNLPILNCRDITVIFPIGIFTIAVMLCINSRGETIKYSQIFYVEVIMEYIAGIFIPQIYTIIYFDKQKSHPNSFLEPNSNSILLKV